MKATKIHNGQWIAENKVIRPENIFSEEREEPLWYRYEKMLLPHRYATDIEDGIYQADDLELIWQAKHPQQEYWYKTLSQPENDEDGFESFSEFMLPGKTRQLVIISTP